MLTLATAAPLAGLAAAVAVWGAWEALGAVEQAGAARALAERLGPLLRLARDGREPGASERRRLALLGAGVLAVAGWLVAGPAAALACGAGGPSAARALVRQRRRRYRAALGRAAPAVARAVADALGAGHSIPGALAEAERGVEGAARRELAAVAGMARVGEPLPAALAQLRARGGQAYDPLVAAILLQREAGGDLATLLRELAAAREEAQRLEDDARAATAQARFTGLVVGVLPAGAAALAELARPGALAEIAQVPLAAWLAGFALVLQAVALVAIRRLARVPA